MTYPNGESAPINESELFEQANVGSGL